MRIICGIVLGVVLSVLLAVGLLYNSNGNDNVVLVKDITFKTQYTATEPSEPNFIHRGYVTLQCSLTRHLQRDGVYTGMLVTMLTAKKTVVASYQPMTVSSDTILYSYRDKNTGRVGVPPVDENREYNDINGWAIRTCSEKI